MGELQHVFPSAGLPAKGQAGGTRCLCSLKAVRLHAAAWQPAEAAAARRGREDECEAYIESKTTPPLPVHRQGRSLGDWSGQASHR